MKDPNVFVAGSDQPLVLRVENLDSYYINDGSPRLNKDTVYEHFDIAFRTYMLRQVRRIGSLLDLNWNRLDCFTQLGWAYEVIFIHQS